VLDGAVDFAKSAAHAYFFVGDNSFHHIASYLSVRLAWASEHINMEVDVICAENCSAHDCSFGKFYECFTGVSGHFVTYFLGSSIMSGMYSI
jgi:hypothetical protein